MFKYRSHKKELLDGENIPEKDLFQNLKELDFINKWLGGYAISFNALKKILIKNKPYTLLDIGSGGGDTLKRIFDWNKKNKYTLSLAGIDLKQSCVNYSIQNKPNSSITFICDDYRNMKNHFSEIDIIHACLFTHHLSNQQILELIAFAQKNKSILIINDLQRNPVAYYAIKFLTALFSKSYLVKNDAPLSVLRGFKKNEWIDLLKLSNVKNYSLNYKWAFRYEVIIYAN